MAWQAGSGGSNYGASLKAQALALPQRMLWLHGVVVGGAGCCHRDSWVKELVFC